jgi:hypothetical protein
MKKLFVLPVLFFVIACGGGSSSKQKNLKKKKQKLRIFPRTRITKRDWN